MTRLETTFGPVLAGEPPGRERRGEALELPEAQVFELEQPPDQPTRRLADRHRSRRRERLQARSQIRHLAGHRPLARFIVADEVADHDQTGRDPDPCLQRDSRLELESGDLVDQASPARAARSASSSCAWGQPK